MTSRTTTAGSHVAAPSSRRDWAAMVILSAALALDSGSVAVINPALPEVGRGLSMSEAGLQWVVTSYALAFAGFLLLGGRLADVIGRRLVFTVGVALFAICSVVATTAPDAAVLIGARAGQGLGAALSGPASLALVTQIFPEGPRRNKAFAIYTSVGASSFSVGLVIGGALTSALGWRSVFVLSAVIGAGVVLGARAFLPASVRQSRPLDIPGAIGVTAGLALAVFGVNQASSAGWSSPEVTGTLAAAAVLLVAFVVWETRTREPMLPLAIFRSSSVRTATVCAVSFYTPLLGMLFFAPLYMQGLLGYSPLESGAAIVPMGIIVISAATVAGRLMGRIGQRPLIIIGLVLIGVGVGVLWSNSPLNGNYWDAVLPGVAVMSVGQGLAFAAMTAASMTGVPQEQHGVASAFNVTAQQIGGSIGVAALVTVAHSFTSGTSPAGILRGYHAAFAVAGGIGAAGAVVIAVGAAGHLLRKRPGAAAMRHDGSEARRMICPTPCCANEDRPELRTSATVS